MFLHSAAIARFGGLEGVRDEALLESALNRPKNRFLYDAEADLFSLAASYGFGLAKNHSLHDGNKRIAYAVIGAFLKFNGYDLMVDQIDAIRVISGLAASEITEEELANWIRSHSQRRR